MKFLRILSIILSGIIMLCVTGCNGDVNKETSSWREPYDSQAATQSFVDTDGNFEYKTVEWNGPEDYVIDISQKPEELRDVAKKLSDYYSLAIEENTTSNNSIVLLLDDKMAKNDLKVSVEKGNLVFSAGHSVTLKSAIEKYIRIAPQKGTAAVFELATDFSDTVLDGYKYVWGDEFEGNDVDFTKWDFEVKMSGTEKMEVSYDKNVIDVEDGRLKLHALRYYNPNRAKTEYRVPYSVVTEHKMNYVYGYVEIRCRLPFFKGTWPSFWTQSTDALGGKVSSKFMAEVDIFEVFGDNVVKPQLIKWYRNNDKHPYYSDFAEVTNWTWKNIDTIENEYHTYGWEWTPEKMVMYVDGEAYMTFDTANSYDGISDMSGFNDPMFLMFNNHLITEDSWQTGYTVENSNEQLPSCYYIDYIRLYQKEGVGKIYIDDTDTSSKYSGRK